MADVREGSGWEVYSDREGQWVRAVVFKIENGMATLRYEGLLEFLTVPLTDLDNKPEMFRQSNPVPPAD